MINTTFHFYKNLVLSLSSLSPGHFWQSAIHWHFIFLPVILIAFLCSGTFRGYRTEQIHGRKLLIMEIVLLALWISSAIVLFINPCNSWPGLFFLTAFSASLYLTGTRLGSFFASLRQGPIAVCGFITVFIVLLLAIAFSR
jgi:hypothetical protein